MTELVSSCCGASGFEYEDYGICPACKEHCDFVDLDEDDDDNKTYDQFHGETHGY